MNYDIAYAHSQPPAIPFKECVVAFVWLKWAFIMKLIWDHYNSSKFKGESKHSSKSTWTLNKMKFWVVTPHTNGNCCSHKGVWKVTMTTLWVATTRHHRTENLSGEFLDSYLRYLQREGKAGSKKASTTTHGRQLVRAYTTYASR